MDEKTLSIDRKKCTSCRLCERVCLRKAVDISEYRIDKNKCFLCFHCVSICPEQAVSFNGTKPDRLSAYKVDKKDFDNLIFSRRTCRVFTEKSISRETLDEIINLMRFSPTGTNSQNVFLTVLSEREKVRNLTDKIIKLFDLIYKLKLLLFLPLLFILGSKNTVKFFNLKKNIDRYHKGEDILAFNAPVLLLFHTSAKISSTPAEDCDIASAIAILRAELTGLGTCYNGYIVRAVNFSKKIRTGLGIPADHRVYTSLLIGHPGIKYKNLVHRDPVKINYV